MRTHLLSLAATLTVIGFATTSVAVPLSTPSSGGSSGGVSAPSGGGGSSNNSGGGSGGGSSDNSSQRGAGGGGSGAGAAARGGSFGGGAANRGGGFEARSGFSGYRIFAAQARDLAHGGYQVLAARPADHSSLELGPAAGSAAEAARRNDDKRRVLPNPNSHPRHPRQLPEVTLLHYLAKCPPKGCKVPREVCPAYWYVEDTDPNDSNSALDCLQPIKLQLSPHH